MQFLSLEGLLYHGLKVRPMVLPDSFIDHDSPAKQYDAAGLNAPQIVAMAMSALGRAHELRSEEHTSELQSLMRISYAVFCLKKKKQKTQNNHCYNNKHTTMKLQSIQTQPIIYIYQ